jgi:hypothetical protein
MDLWLSEEQDPQLTQDVVVGKDVWVVAKIATEADTNNPERTLDVIQAFPAELLPAVVAAARGERLYRPKKPRELEPEPFTEANFEGCEPVGILEFTEASRTLATYSDEMVHRKIGSRLWTALTKHVRAEHEGEGICNCGLAWHRTGGGGTSYDLQGLARMYSAIKDRSVTVYGIRGKSLLVIRETLINALPTNAKTDTKVSD